MCDEACAREDGSLAGGFSWPRLNRQLAQLEGNAHAIGHARRLLFANRELLLREPRIRVVQDDLEATWRCGDHRLRVSFGSNGSVSFQCWPPEWLLSQVLEDLADVIIQRAAVEIQRLPPPDPDDVDQPTEPPAGHERQPRAVSTAQCRCESCGRTFGRTIRQVRRNSQRGYRTFCSQACSVAHRRSSDEKTGG